jgi:hypothetical protein
LSRQSEARDAEVTALETANPNVAMENDDLKRQPAEASGARATEAADRHARRRFAGLKRESSKMKRASAVRELEANLKQTAENVGWTANSLRLGH